MIRLIAVALFSFQLGIRASHEHLRQSRSLRWTI